ncbi:MAG TPA: DNA replication/repair protein RecF [bacterium]|nr:DNA replication/repair protein RecF [bacterium]
MKNQPELRALKKNMFLNQIKVRNFRNIEAADLKLGTGYNVFLGANAQGKTNILESILFLATSTSHRTLREKYLIRHGQDVAYIQGEIDTRRGPVRLESGLSLEKKILKVQGRPLSRVGDLYGHLRVVLFAPEDLFLIKGSPRLRRKFLDLAIAQVQPDHVPLLQSYRKLLRQRQTILRQRADHPGLNAQLDAWEQQLAIPAAEIVSRRRSLVTKLTERTRHLAEQLSGGADCLELIYRSSVGDFDPAQGVPVFLERFRASRERDRQQKQSTVGPHRDELSFLLHGRDVAVFGSQGQVRAASLVLRLAEASLIETEAGEAPVLLIDDVIFEMDAGRRTRFFALLPKASQGLVTATQQQDVAPLIDAGHVFEVKMGTFTALDLDGRTPQGGTS